MDSERTKCTAAFVAGGVVEITGGSVGSELGFDLCHAFFQLPDSSTLGFTNVCLL